MHLSNVIKSYPKATDWILLDWIRSSKVVENLWQAIGAAEVRRKKTWFEICSSYCLAAELTREQSARCAAAWAMSAFETEVGAGWVTRSFICPQPLGHQMVLPQPRFAKRVQQGTFDVDSFSKCYEKYGEIYCAAEINKKDPRFKHWKHLMDQKVLIARARELTKGGHMCQGDSGSPLFVRKNNRFVQIGVTGFISKIEDNFKWPPSYCSWSKAPHYYVNVVAYSDNIRNIIRKDTNDLPVS